MAATPSTDGKQSIGVHEPMISPYDGGQLNLSHVISQAFKQ